MKNISIDISSLSLAQRALLEQRLKQKRAASPANDELRAGGRLNSSPLSFAQQRIWFLQQLEPESPFYNGATALRLRGSLDIGALESTLTEIVRRHEILRTSFPSEDGKPKQVVSPAEPMKLRRADLTGAPQQSREREAKSLIESEAMRPFDLERGPLMRPVLIRLSESDHVLAMVLHHIISDFWSFGVFVNELAVLYDSHCNGTPSTLHGLPIQYADYAEWQHQWLQSKAYEKQLEYWTGKLAGLSGILALPADKSRPAVQTFSGKRRRRKLPRQLAAALNELSSREGSTLFMTLLSAFNVLLYRFTGQTDIPVGTPIANRNRAETEALIGFFANTLVLRTDLSGAPSFRQLMARTREVALGAIANQEMPLERIVECLQPDRDLSYTPLFQVMFQLQNMPARPVRLRGLSVELMEVETRTAKFDLELSVIEAQDGLNLLIEYSTDLFEAATIDRMLDSFQRLVEAIIEDPDRSIALLPILDEAQRRRLLVEWNETGIEHPLETCLHELFQQQVERAPGRVAVSCDGLSLTYDELNRKANALARLLIERGVGADVIVPILAHRGIDYLIAILAIFKAGGAYLPLDPLYPPARLRQILKQSSSKMVLASDSLAESLSQAFAEPDQPEQDQAEQGQERIDEADRPALLSIEEMISAGGDFDNLPRRSDARNLAYVIYTSGSTGIPKGAMVEQSGMVNHAFAKIGDLDLQAGDVVAQTASQCFDISVWQFLAPLLVGARVQIFRDEISHNPARLAEQTENERVTILEVVPSLLRAMLEELNSSGSRECFSRLRWMMVTGEALPPDLCDDWFELFPAIPLINAYGPTECSDDVTHHPIRESQNGVPRMAIGRPISNTQIYVLDGALLPVPVGVSGELYVGGAGVGRGYLFDPATTSGVFIPDLYGTTHGARLYKTGDLARYRSDGTIEFLGRIDHQVKVRGFRIELGEIEHALAQHEAVRETVVLAREDRKGHQRLVAYVVADSERDALINDLRSLVKEKLPEYMVPTAFVLLDEFALNANGKVDRRALPPPREDDIIGDSEFVAPRTPVEEIVAGIWSELLKVNRVSVVENFFELGGHSLLATQVISRIRAAFQTDVPLRRLFEAPTIAQLAESIDDAIRGGDAHQTSILPFESDGPLPLSFSQQRLWFIDQLEPGNPVYNVPIAARLYGQLDAGVLARSLTEIVRRHEVLRTVFLTMDGKPFQQVKPAQPVEVALIDLQNVAEEWQEHEAKWVAAQEAQVIFDLMRGPLLRASLIRIADRYHVLLLTVHHIVSDGWSVGLLLKELGALYEAFSLGLRSPLEELGIQYGDYAVWQRGWLEGEQLDRQMGYWKGQLKGESGELELPVRRGRVGGGGKGRYRGRSQEVRVSAEVSERLREMSRREGVTLYMTLLAAFKSLLYRYTQQEEITVGSPIANRNRLETENLIGFFVNTLVLRTDFSSDPSFRELLRRVRKVALDSYSHQDLPFEKLVEELHPERDLNRSPFFRVMFVLQSAPLESMEFSGLTIKPFDVDYGIAKFDLLVNLWDWPEEVGGIVQYSTELFDDATITRLITHFTTLLEGVISDPSQKIRDLPLLPAEESNRLLVEWNDTGSNFSDQLSITDLFEEQARKTPGAVALVDGFDRLSYAQLDLRANRLANHLRRLGVGAESLVGVCLDRSAEMLVGLLAVLKAGGGYVPLDPTYPAERLGFILCDCKAKVLLTSSRFKDLLPDAATTVVCLDEEQEAIANQGHQPPGDRARAGNIAYVIYTSGSTGVPKGVAIEHRSAAIFLQWARQTFSGGYLAGVLASTSICFDLSIFELFAPLTCGGKVILAENVLHLPALPAREEVSLINTVPSALTELLRIEGVPSSVKIVNLAGEPLQNRLVRQAYAVENIERVFNLYGPSEDTTYSTFAEMGRSPEYSPTIGKSIADTQVYILDSALRPVPIGVAGELYICGKGLARGYFNRPELTAERFIPCLYRAEAGARMYRTGDLARYLPDGEIEFLGRRDHQVKIRGFRIELGEIEAVLNDHPAIQQCAATVHDDGRGNRRIVAYVVAAVRPAPQPAELRAFIRQRLPEYMSPSTFVMLDSLPLTPNGKIDRRALSAPPQLKNELRNSSVQDQDQLEQIISGVWAELLDADRIDRTDNFFDLGGHSLLAVQVISRLRNVLGIEIPLRAIFESPTVAGLAVHLSEQTAAEGGLPSIEVAPIENDFPLSYGQRRLWFIDQLEPNNPAYNLPGAIRLEGVFDFISLERSLREILLRHETLRTTIVLVNGEPVQRVNPPSTECLALIDLTEVQEPFAASLSRELAAEDSTRPFDLANGPLARFTLMRLSPEHHILLFNVHHIVSDGWSVGLLLKEMGALYEAFSLGHPSPLEELVIQYGDYAVWQRGWLEGDELDRQMGYWKGQLKGEAGELELPVRRGGVGRNGGYRGRSQEVRVSVEVSERLREMSRREGVTLYMTLLAAFKSLLYSYSPMDELSVGTPVAGRRHIETEGLMGLFVNTLVLRTSMEDSLQFCDLLKQVRRVTLDAHAHQDLPFEKLVEELKPGRDQNSTPFFQAWFVLDNAPDLKLPGLKVSPLEITREAVRHDLRLGFLDTQDGLIGSFEYRTGLFADDVIAAMRKRFEIILETVLANSEIRLGDLSIIAREAEDRRRSEIENEFKNKARRNLISTRRKKLGAPTSLEQ